MGGSPQAFSPSNPTQKRRSHRNAAGIETAKPSTKLNAAGIETGEAHSNGLSHSNRVAINWL